MTKLYNELAGYYDLIYHWKDYKNESADIRKEIKKYTLGKELLDVGCGTGEHLKHLKGYKITGLDLNKEMLNVAKKKLPKARLVHADMTDFDLKKKFDVVLSMFSSIGYAKTKRLTKRVIKNLYTHTKPGGICILEPWLTPKEFKPGISFLHTFESDDLKIARASRSTLKANISVIEMQYLVLKKGNPIRHLKDEHVMGVFSADEMAGFLKEAGFKIIEKKKGERGYYICTT